MDYFNYKNGKLFTEKIDVYNSVNIYKMNFLGIKRIWAIRKKFFNSEIFFYVLVH